MTADLPISFEVTADRAVTGIDPTTPVSELAERTQEMAKAMIARGDACPVGEEEDVNDLECRLLHFVWAEQAKRFLMLYRDVQLQLQIASLKVKEDRADRGRVAALYDQSREALQAALREWDGDFAARRDALLRNERQRNRQLRAWKLQHNPWPLYRHQIETIAEQSAGLAEEFTRLSAGSEEFDEIRVLLRRGVSASEEVMTKTLERAGEITAFITEGDYDPDRPGIVAAKLEDYISEEGTRPRLDRFTNAITAGIAKLPESQRVTVTAEEGLLKYKEVNFRRSTDQWVSAEIMPLLYELWELSEQTNNGLNVAIVNVRNRALLLSNEAKAGHEVTYTNDELAQPFTGFQQRSSQRRQEYARIRERIEELIDDNLRLTSVYRPVAGFLPLPLQSGINVFTRRQSRFITVVREWLADHVSGLSKLLGDAAREEKLSISEKTVRVIQQRTASPDNAAYTNILMTKGYIGESFLVGRESETAHLRQLIEHWKLGYRGAVMLTGNRLAGKTLFGELITNRFFPSQAIRLRPHAQITVSGRRLRTTGDLAEALAFVEKYTVQSRPLVWIDDLELWWDDDHTLAENVRALGHHIDDYSARIFYLVATTNAVYRHLGRFLDLHRVFQSEINLDRFSLDDMRRAVLIRHGATHKIMVDAEGEPVSETGFGQMVKRIYRATDGNVGETIDRWAYYTERYDNERVYQPKMKRHTLPAFLTPDTATLLAAVLLEKRTRDYRLRKLFGPAYNERYGSILQRLIRIGLITRNHDGSVEVTESVVNDVGRMLESEAYLQYSK
ncbi:ATP-binding protein [Lewinella sp. JB7]|uniref:ATP-binding protein n=1 Tax=Lewinella sp. JB7 TaxID=2962887 RepID=UPI0020C9CF3E|nr:ATP-binding protein [Lewinella sp. JB7]MCP9236145.1 ATP-binding protein [Lewinella sp. JB7]